MFLSSGAQYDDIGHPIGLKAPDIYAIIKFLLPHVAPSESVSHHQGLEKGNVRLARLHEEDDTTWELEIETFINGED